jgi:hypothetical protein
MLGLIEAIDDARAGIEVIGSYLDGLDGAARWREVAQLDRARQRALYVKAASAAPIDFAHFVGNARPREEIIHDGINTLPVLASWKRFQKRFCRPDDEGDDGGNSGNGGNLDGRGRARLFGYNEGPTRRFIGPGFFVAVATADRPAWSARGAIVIDYFRVPDGAVADGWPQVISNDRQLQRFVYGQTRDFMRRVSRHVSIGIAFKRERSLDHYFVLCRRG